MPALKVKPEFDSRTEKNLKTLNPKAASKARDLLRSCAAKFPDFEVRIVDGSRTYEEQNALYAQGRTKPGHIVTNAKGGQSWHNFGIAFDIGVFKGGKYLGESSLYAKVGAVGKMLGLEWGGDWATIIDQPHFQLKTGLTLAQARARVKAGKDVTA
jgi:peptidoglycan L-alanyl-D-glutamate endopeptidase CwlK